VEFFGLKLTRKNLFIIYNIFRIKKSRGVIEPCFLVAKEE